MGYKRENRDYVENETKKQDAIRCQIRYRKGLFVDYETTQSRNKIAK